MDFLRLQRNYKSWRSRIFTALVRPSFGAIGKGSHLYPPFHSNNAREIFIGENCKIFWEGWLDAVTSYAGRTFQPRLEIGDGTYIGRHCHIIACGHLRIGQNVVMADGVYITDCLHGYENPHVPVLEMPLKFPGNVNIEDQVWIGERVCVMPGVTIGRHSVVAANSVVTKDLPPYSVAAGIPARVIKRYVEGSGRWEAVHFS